MATFMLREIGIPSLGFRLYADRGVIKFWNTMLLFIISAMYSGAYAGFQHVLYETNSVGKCGTLLSSANVIHVLQAIWAALLVILSLVDEGIMVTACTTAEATPFV